MRPRLRVYFLHNIDGRCCGVMAASSKDQVRDVCRVPASEIVADDRRCAEHWMALAEPGTLFVAPISARGPVEWVRYGKRHPAHVPKVDGEGAADDP